MRIIQLTGEVSPPPELRPPQVKLPRNYNQIARRRIRQFESDMPSQAVGLQCVLNGHPECAGACAVSQATRAALSFRGPLAKLKSDGGRRTRGARGLAIGMIGKRNLRRGESAVHVRQHQDAA
jgi:hypothetical protein